MAYSNSNSIADLIAGLPMVGYGAPASAQGTLSNLVGFGNDYYANLFGNLGQNSQPEGFQIAQQGPYQIRPDGKVVDIRTGQIRYDGHGNLTPQQAAQMLNRGGR